MKLTQLSETQVKQVNLFNLILECDGWVDEDSVEGRLQEGQDVSPEGKMSIRTDHVILESQLHIPVQMISLSITDRVLKHKVDIFFFYDENPEWVLEWMVSARDQLNLDNFQQLLERNLNICRTILLAETTAESIELKPLTAG